MHRILTYNRPDFQGDLDLWSSNKILSKPFVSAAAAVWRFFKVMDAQKTFDSVLAQARDTARLEAAYALLEWDEHTYIPSQAGAYRAEQVELLSGLIHQRRTTAELGDWLRELAASSLAKDRNEPVGAAIAGWLRDYEKQVKLPQRLVEEMAKATSLGQQAWVAARSADRCKTLNRI